MATLPTIDIPFAPNRVADYNGPGDPCAVCGKATPNPAGWLWTRYGGEVTDPERARLNEPDSWWMPIGRECLRAHPELRPYLVKDPRTF